MYNLFYKLNDLPFGLKPDLKYFYATRPHKRAIMHMRLGLEQPDGVLILTGEKGIGKTTLITYMLNQLDKSSNSVAFIQNPPQKLRDFLPAIMDALQIPVAERQPNVLFNTYRAYMLEQAKQNKKVLLVIDDANKLSQNCLEFIQLLSTLQVNGQALLQIVLVGENELDEILSANQYQTFSEKITMSHSIHPLQETDTREYIDHRLKVAGWNRDPLIDERAYAAIHQLAGGVPYEINRYCDQLLMLGALSESHRISQKDVSNLTTTMESLEEINVKRPKPEKRNTPPKTAIPQPLPPHAAPNKAAPAHVAFRENDVEEFLFNTPSGSSKPLSGKHKTISIAAACVLISLAVFFFNKISVPNLPLATSVSHSEATNHSAAEESHGIGSNTHEYILGDISTESGAHGTLNSDVHDAPLLDIQQLLSNFSKVDTKSDQSVEDLAIDAESNTSDLSADNAEENTTTPAAEPHSRTLFSGLD